MARELNAKALGFSLAIVSAISMVLLWIGGKTGVYVEAFEQMQNWHIFFSLSIGGLIGGVIEASIWSFIGGWLIALVYNKFA